MRAIKLFSSVRKISWGIFKLFGFVPGLFHGAGRGDTVEIYSMTWSTLVMIGVTMYGAVILMCQEKIFNQTPIGNINDTLKFLTGTVAHFVSLCESMMKVKKFRMIFKRMSMLDDECKTLNINFAIHQRTFLRCYAIRFLAFCLLFILVEAHVYLNIELPTFFLANLFPSSACRMRHLQYMFYLHLILSKVKIIQIELVRSFDEARYRFQNSTTYARDCEELIDRLQVLKNVYGMLWRTTHDINEMFVWSITANLIHNFVQIGCDSYWTWTFFNFQEELDPDMTIRNSLILIVNGHLHMNLL